MFPFFSSSYHNVLAFFHSNTGAGGGVPSVNASSISGNLGASPGGPHALGSPTGAGNLPGAVGGAAVVHSASAESRNLTTGYPSGSGHQFAVGDLVQVQCKNWHDFNNFFNSSSLRNDQFS